MFARWYRPPELLFGSTCYGSSIDIWAAGCVFAELLLRRPWLPGSSDIDQLGKIFQALGTPTPESWPTVQQLPNYVEFQKVAPPPLRQQFPQAGEDALDLLSLMVSLDPSKRPTGGCPPALLFSILPLVPLAVGLVHDAHPPPSPGPLTPSI